VSLKSIDVPGTDVARLFGLVAIAATSKVEESIQLAPHLIEIRVDHQSRTPDCEWVDRCGVFLCGCFVHGNSS
jgi:hypothetical protein